MSVTARVRLMFVLAAAVVLGACSSGGATPLPEGPIMAVQSRGGMCFEGTCRATIYVESNGLVHSADKPPNELGIVPEAQMADLISAINTADFAEIRSHRFADTCPTAFDGQELVFEFAAPSGVERIESCQVDVDYQTPLFSAVALVMRDYGFGMVDEPGVGPERPEPPPDPPSIPQN